MHGFQAKAAILHSKIIEQTAANASQAVRLPIDDAIGLPGCGPTFICRRGDVMMNLVVNMCRQGPNLPPRRIEAVFF